MFKNYSGTLCLSSNQMNQNSGMSLFWQDEPMDTDQSSTFLSSIQSEIAKYQLLIEEENQKLKRYKVRLLFPAV